VLNSRVHVLSHDHHSPSRREGHQDRLWEKIFGGPHGKWERLWWGDKEEGQLGLGLQDPIQVHPLVPEGDKIVDVACGSYTTSLLTEKGNLYQTVGYPVSSIQKMDLSDVAQITNGSVFSMAITKDGSLYSWGWNGHGSLGLGDNADRYTPSLILPDIEAVACGGSHTLALKKDGSLWSWGHSIGIGRTSGNFYVAAPVDFSSISENSGSENPKAPKISAFGCGDDFSYIINPEGNLYMWGTRLYEERGPALPELISRFKVKQPVPRLFMFTETKWRHVISWLFLGKSDKNSGFSRFPEEVIFHVVKILDQK